MCCVPIHVKSLMVNDVASLRLYLIYGKDAKRKLQSVRLQAITVDQVVHENFAIYIYIISVVGVVKMSSSTISDGY